MSLLIEIDRLVAENSQFIISTHSPILMAYPGAEIYEITGGVYADMRKALLETEGVAFLPDGRVDMNLCGIKEVKK